MTNARNLQIGDDRDRALDQLARPRELLRMEDFAEERIQSPHEEESFDFRRYWLVLVRRKWIVLAAVIVAMMVALVETFDTTPMYRSTLLLQIEPQIDQFLEYQGDVSLGESARGWNYYKTQYELLHSRSLARRVIDQLGLEAAVRGKSTPAAATPSFLAELKQGIRGLLGGDRDPPADAHKAKSEDAKANLEGALLANLSVTPVPDSRLVHISYESASPQEAAAVANAVADNFVNMTLERRYDATGYAKKFLEDRIEQVRANLEDSEQRLLTYAGERGIVNLDDKLGNLMQTLNAMSQALVQAETERIGAEAEYAQSLKGKGPSVLKVIDSEVIQALKARKGELQLTYQEQRKLYKPGHPNMRQLKQQIGEIDGQIRGEIAAISEAVKADYAAKVEKQATLQARVNEIKTEIRDLQNRSKDYQTLKREVETNRQLYDGLLQRMKEVGVVAGITTNNISIVDRAQVPTDPYKPNLSANLTKALVIGLVAGILLALLFEYLDDAVKTSEDVENRARVPVLGTIPLANAKDYAIGAEEIPLLAASDPKSPLAEAVRSLRASLVFSTADGAPKIMHVTSAGPGEGKTTTATNIAIAFAQAGGKVLMIDADLRAPSLHSAFSLPNNLGLTNYLAGNTKPVEIAQPTQVSRVFAITSGPLPPNPVELLSSAKMLDLLSLASERFDFVLIDGPPIIGLADALFLSKLSQGTIFVVEAGRTRYGEIEGAIKRLRAANTTLLGAVLSKLDPRSKKGYGYDYQYHYHYSYGDTEQSPALPATE